MLIDKHEIQEINRVDLRVEFKLYQESKSITNGQYIKKLKIKDHEFHSYKNRGTARDEVIETIATFFGRKAIHDDRVKPLSQAIDLGKKSTANRKANPKACSYRLAIEEHQANNEYKDLARQYA